jgi:hypothetical protein
MNLTIPVVAPGRPSEILREALGEMRLSGVSIAKPVSGGLAVDPGTLALVVEVVKVTLPALLAAIATVWAAKIGKGAKEPNTEPGSSPKLVLELDDSEITLDLDACKGGALSERTPQNMDAVVRIRLEH